MTLDSRLIALLVCPKCRGELTYREAAQALDCAACNLRYQIRDGIPVMLVDEATQLP